MDAAWWRKKIVDPLVELLRQGVTPEKIALMVALGLALGVIPLIGLSSILCGLAAVVFRLNLPAIQLVNYLAYPLQIALIIPFLRLGAWMFGAPPIRATASEIVEMVRRDLPHTLVVFSTALLHALAAWLPLGFLAAGLLYLILTPVLRRMRRAYEGSLG